MKNIHKINKAHPPSPICPKRVNANPEPFDAPSPIPKPPVSFKIFIPDIMTSDRTSADVDDDLFIVMS